LEGRKGKTSRRAVDIREVWAKKTKVGSREREAVGRARGIIAAVNDRQISAAQARIIGEEGPYVRGKGTPTKENTETCDEIL